MTDTKGKLSSHEERVLELLNDGATLQPSFLLVKDGIEVASATVELVDRLVEMGFISETLDTVGQLERTEPDHDTCDGLVPDIDIPQANGIKINVCGHGVVHIVLFDEADAPIAVGSLPRAMFDKIVDAIDDVAAERAEDKPAIEIPHGTIH